MLGKRENPPAGGCADMVESGSSALPKCGGAALLCSVLGVYLVLSRQEQMDHITKPGGEKCYRDMTIPDRTVKSRRELITTIDAGNSW